MDEIDLLDSQMNQQRERLSIEIGDIREQVETCRDDAAWQELPLSAKLRVLIKERLEQLQDAKESKAKGK